MEIINSLFNRIGSRLVITYLLLILTSTMFFEVISIYAVNTYYMNTIDTVMKKYSETVANFYTGYLSDKNIEANAKTILSIFYSQLDVHIQITDDTGKVIEDSLNLPYNPVLIYPDVKEAIKGMQSKYIEYDSASKENTLSYCVPLKLGNRIAGTARFTTTLKLAEEATRTIAFYLILIGIIVVLVNILISLYFSNTITKPIKNITNIALEMAKGNLHLRSTKKRNDEIGLLSDALNTMAEEIQKNDKLKNEFISSITHELRTPLTSIKGWAATLLNTPQKDMDLINRGIYIISSESDRFSEMLEELLDFSRLQSSKFSLFFEHADINGLIKNVYDQMIPIATAKNIDMTLNLLKSAQILEIDIRRMKQIFINLIDNAVKYTDFGGKVFIYLEKDSNFISVIIEDTGLGIDEEELILVKKRFFRGSNIGASKGIGLGLSICEELIHGHNGELEIISEYGKGTKAIVKIPSKS